MSLVIGGRRELMQDFSRRVGIGSKSHDLTVYIDVNSYNKKTAKATVLCTKKAHQGENHLYELAMERENSLRL